MSSAQPSINDIIKETAKVLKLQHQRIETLEKVNLVLFKYLKDVLQYAKFFDMDKQGNILADFEKDIQTIITEFEKTKEQS